MTIAAMIIVMALLLGVVSAVVGMMTYSGKTFVRNELAMVTRWKAQSSLIRLELRPDQ
jgi:hypothetical protein